MVGMAHQWFRQQKKSRWHRWRIFFAAPVLWISDTYLCATFLLLRACVLRQGTSSGVVNENIISMKASISNEIIERNIEENQ